MKESILSKLGQLEKYYQDLTKEQRELEAKISGLKSGKGSYQLKKIRGYGPYLYFVSPKGKWTYIGAVSENFSKTMKKHEEAKRLFSQLKGVMREKRRILKIMRKIEGILAEV
ncbi:MAG: hypothetical protein ACP6IS_11120 [Candidatus Asgardarchaeia archaeon]